MAEIVAQSGVYATSIAAGTPLGTEFANYNTHRVALAQAWKEWAEEAETEGQDSAEVAAGARTTYAQTMADAYRTMVGFEASEVQTASVALSTAQATEILSLVQASAADLVRMAPLESKYRVDVAQAEKTYQSSMAKAALSESNRSTLEEAAGDARTEALKRLRDAYARDEQQAALTYAQAIASAQNTSASSQAGIQKTRALTASAVLKDFTQTQKTAATTRVDTEADADREAAVDRGYSWKSKTDALADDSAFPSPFAEYDAALADAGDRRIRTSMDAGRTKLKDSVAADQLAVLNKRFAQLDFAVSSSEKESDWLVDAVEKATTKNQGQVQAMGAKTASGEYDPDLLFSTPNSPIAANAGQAAASLGSGGAPSHGWNPGTYVGYYGDSAYYGWYGVGSWNEGATSVSPDGGIAWTYSGSYGYGYGYDGYLGSWDPWYGDGWYGDVASAFSYGEFSYSQLSSLTAEPGQAAEVATPYGLPATATDKPASTAPPPESTDVLGPEPGYGAEIVAIAADAERDLITGSAGSDVIEEAKAAAPPPTPFIGPLPAPPRTGNVVVQEVAAKLPAAGQDSVAASPRLGTPIEGLKFESGPEFDAEAWTQGLKKQMFQGVLQKAYWAIADKPIELWDAATEQAIAKYLNEVNFRGIALEKTWAAEFVVQWRELVQKEKPHELNRQQQEKKLFDALVAAAKAAERMRQDNEPYYRARLHEQLSLEGQLFWRGRRDPEHFDNSYTWSQRGEMAGAGVWGFFVTGPYNAAVGFFDIAAQTGQGAWDFVGLTNEVFGYYSGLYEYRHQSISRLSIALDGGQTTAGGYYLNAAINIPTLGVWGHGVVVHEWLQGRISDEEASQQLGGGGLMGLAGAGILRQQGGVWTQPIQNVPKYLITSTRQLLRGVRHNEEVPIQSPMAIRRIMSYEAWGDLFRTVRDVPTGHKGAPKAAEGAFGATGLIIERSGIRPGQPVPPHLVYPEGTKFVSCALPKAWSDAIGQGVKTPTITIGGFISRDGVVVFKPPCARCEQILKLNPHVPFRLQLFSPWEILPPLPGAGAAVTPP